MTRHLFSSRDRGMTPRLFAVVVGVVLAILAVLCWMLIRQEIQLGEERRRDRLDAELLRASERMESEYQQLQQQLAALETAGLQALWPAGVTVRLSDEEVAAVPEERLLYAPRSRDFAPDPVLERADRLEFVRGDLTGARAVLTAALGAASEERTAGIRIRLARIARKLDQPAEASRQYRALTEMAGATVDGTPAPWLGWYGLCSSEQEDRSECAGYLASSMRSGTERPDAATYSYYVDVLEEWELPDQTLMPPHEDALSEAVIALDATRSDVRAGRAAERGISVQSQAGSEIVVVWRVSGDRMWALAVPVQELLDRWLPSDRFQSDIYMVDADSDLPEGRDPEEALVESIPFSLGGERFIMLARETEEIRAASGVEARLFVLAAILVLVALIVASSLFFVGRALRQEFEVARLQSEFVAAVSHEFRTPLTSMRQLTEMLASGRVHKPERIQQYYALLDREASRLTRLVESLLNFGRMETGGFTYNLERVAIDELVASVIAEFCHERTREVRKTGHVSDLVVVDADMMSLALWNLLDNADKYAPENTPVEVNVSLANSDVRIAVSDEGPGVDPSDSERIFDKFVRAGQASETTVKGTGLGLALVRRIMEDHGGRVELEGSSGRGATFTLYLSRDDDAHTDR